MSLRVLSMECPSDLSGPSAIEEIIPRLLPSKTRSATLLDSLRRFSSALPADPSRDAALDRYERGAVAVVTGQQPGIFAGPLYIHFKIATAIAVVRSLKLRGIDAVPIFWNASEDHDLDEANRFFYPSKRGDTVALFRFRKRNTGKMLADLRIERDDLSLLDGVVVREGLDSVREDLPTIGEDFGRWTNRIIARHFHGNGLMIVEPRVIAPLAVSVWDRFIVDHGIAHGAMEPAAQRARASGDDRAASRVLERNVGIFAIEEGRRTAIVRRDGRLRIGRNPVELPGLRDRLHAAPHNFSSSVLSRPLVQQHVLGSAIQIVGPGEARYLADMEPLFAAFDIPAPIRWMRVSGTVFDPLLRAAIDRSGASIDRFFGPRSSWPPAAHALPAEWPSIAAQIAKRRDLSPDPTIERLCPRISELLREMAARDRTDVRRLDRRFRSRWKKSFGESALDRKIIEERLAPRGRAQERTLAVHSFRTIFPPDFAAELVRVIEPDPRGRYLLSTD